VPEHPPTPEQVAVKVPVFEFHSGFWINLHHFLYQQARQPASARDAVSKAESEAWSAALDYYSRTLAGSDLLVNRDLVNIKNRLAEMEGCADLSGRSRSECASGLRPELVRALERAAPVYRAKWWPQHDRANRAWVAAAAPLIEKYGAVLAERLAEIYQEGWPAERLPVDVSYVANAVGAYTTLDPVSITIASGDPRNRGLASLEILFHEASHALAGGVRDAIAKECRARNKPIPRDLWHALLFYTAGEVVRHALEESRAAGAGPAEGEYTPYARREGLYARGWENYLRLFERHWQPYLDGKLEFDRAVARIVSAL